jgi:hypothetical protein
MTGLPGWARAGMGLPAWGAHPYPGAPTPEQESATLKSQAEYLEGALADIRKRIEDLEAKAQEE